jgi:hypothetical protein
MVGHPIHNCKTLGPVELKISTVHELAANSKTCNKSCIRLGTTKASTSSFYLFI